MSKNVETNNVMKKTSCQKMSKKQCHVKKMACQKSRFANKKKEKKKKQSLI